MSNLKITHLEPEKVSKLIELEKLYLQKYPDYPVRDETIYLNHPAFEGGKNIICAWGQDQLLGFTAIYPVPVYSREKEEPHKIWFDIIVDVKKEDINIVRDKLIQVVEKRALEIKKTLPEKKTLLAVCKNNSEKEPIKYFKAKGFKLTKTMAQMGLEIKTGINNGREISFPEMKIKYWIPGTEADFNKYLEAKNKSYQKQMTLESFRWFLPELEPGIIISAITNDGNIAGSIVVMINDENTAIIEDVFVIPDWRQKGLGSFLLQKGLKYLAEKGSKWVELEVDYASKPAYSLYKKLGFKLIGKDYTLLKEI